MPRSSTALLEAGADFRARVPSGFTPLLFAVREGRTRRRARAAEGRRRRQRGDPARRSGPAQTRLGGGVPPAGTTPLLLAVENAHFELAAALLEAGADPNADGTGYTALHAITAVRKPGVGDNDPAPEGSGT